MQRSLKVGDVVQDKDGNEITVDQAYIDAMGAELAGEDETELKKILELSQDKERLEDLNAKYREMKRARIKDIVNPYYYVEKNKDGKYVRKKAKRVNGNKYFGKKIDSVGIRLSEKLKVDNLLGLDNKTKAALKNQTDFLGSELKGLFGIVVGIPMLIAEPAAGATFLYIGATNASKVFSSKGRKKLQTMNKLRQKYDGKYTLVGFEGKSAETIASGAQMAAMGEYDKQKDLAEKRKNGVNVETPVKDMEYKKHFDEKHRKITKVITLGTKFDDASSTSGILSGAVVNGVGVASIRRSSRSGSIYGSSISGSNSEWLQLQEYQ